MIRILFLFVIFAVCFFSCKKNETTDKCGTGTVIYNNTSANPYYIYLDGQQISAVQEMKTAGATLKKGFISFGRFR